MTSCLDGQVHPELSRTTSAQTMLARRQYTSAPSNFLSNMPSAFGDDVLVHTCQPGRRCPRSERARHLLTKARIYFTATSLLQYMCQQSVAAVDVLGCL